MDARSRRAGACVAALWLIEACGAGGPAGPNPAPGPGDVTLELVAGDTGAPVSGATVVDETTGQRLATDAAGRVSMRLAGGSPLTVEAGGFFVRETVYRGENHLTLWPIRADAGETFVSELVYNRLIADGRLTRPTRPAYLTLPREIENDAALLAHQVQAAATLTAVSGAAIPFEITSAPPAGALTIRVILNAADPVFLADPGLGAVTRVVHARNRIQSGTITFKSLRDAGIFSLVVHEMGHVLGLGHPAQAGLMSPTTISRYRDFTGPERLEINLMLQRLPGTSPPDNDRAASASSARATSLIACPTPQ